MAKIKLTQNQYTLVDNEDVKWLGQWKWNASYSPGTKGYYAVRSQRVKGINEKNKSTTIKMHRAIMEHYYNRKLKRKEIIDHINHNTLDNRKINLRIVSTRQNTQNKKKKGTSRYPGVSLDRNNQKWIAEIRMKNTFRHLGSFNNEKSAAKAYEMCCRLYNLGDLVCKIHKKASYKTNNKFTPFWVLWEKEKSSKYKGVNWDEKKKQWMARITLNNEKIFLGLFNNEISAGKAYEMTCRLYHKKLIYKIKENYKTNDKFTPIWKIRRDKNSSKYEDITWHKSAHKWQAYGNINGKRKYLGLFIDEEKAHEAILKNRN